MTKLLGDVLGFRLVAIDPHSGQERYGDLGEDGQDGDEDESDGAQVVACHHGGDQANH